VIGDGGWYFHVVDIATDPTHQRQGLGRAVVEWLLADIGDPPGQRLYRSLGFDDVAPSLGMGMVLGAGG